MMNIVRERLEQSPGPGKAVSRFQRYVYTGVRRVENRRVTGESDLLQLSNFTILDDREIGKLELYLTKLGADPAEWPG